MGRSSTSSHALTPNTLTTVCFTGGSTEHALISLSDCPHLGERRAPRRLCGLLAHKMFAIDTGDGPLIFRGGPITSVTKAPSSPLSRAHPRILWEKAHGRKGRWTPPAPFYGVQNSPPEVRASRPGS